MTHAIPFQTCIVDSFINVQPVDQVLMKYSHFSHLSNVKRFFFFFYYFLLFAVKRE